ncbi:MAG: hypothetical protein HY393_02070 [Candidatus Diapherotrites archaeon]|nr:hypothetical protein [Candidatus Diapherotrites archaeon]
MPLPLRKRRFRKPVKRHLFWVGAARAQRRSIASNPKKYQSIFAGAQAIHALPRIPHSRMIFIGRGMRPLFETIRGLNEIQPLHPRKYFRYFIAWNSNPSALKVNQEHAALLARQLQACKIVAKETNTYFIVDSPAFGTTFRTLRAAIKMIQPRARVLFLSYRGSPQKLDYPTLRIIRNGIGASDDVPRPTEKKHTGKIRPRLFSEEQADRDEYLSFQKTLQEFLSSKQKKQPNGHS